MGGGQHGWALKHEENEESDISDPDLYILEFKGAAGHNETNEKASLTYTHVQKSLYGRLLQQVESESRTIQTHLSRRNSLLPFLPPGLYAPPPRPTRLRTNQTPRPHHAIHQYSEKPSRASLPTRGRSEGGQKPREVEGQEGSGSGHVHTVLYLCCVRPGHAHVPFRTLLCCTVRHGARPK